MKPDNKDAFRRFWKANGSNHLIALIITLAMCAFVGAQHYLVSLPVWLLIGLVFWALRLLFVYKNWRRDDEKQTRK